MAMSPPAPQCLVCNSPQRRAIEKGLAAGASTRDLEARYGMSRSSLSRHHQQHMEDTPAPVFSLCPLQDDTAQATRRDTMSQALHTAEQQLASVQQQLAALEQELSSVNALHTLHAFAPVHSDAAISHLPAYQAWMQRPRLAREAFEQTLTAWREALQHLARAEQALRDHDVQVDRSTRQRAFLDTPEGQAMELDYQNCCQALQKATALEDGRMIRLYKREKQQIQERFVMAVHTAANVAA